MNPVDRDRPFALPPSLNNDKGLNNESCNKKYSKVSKKNKSKELPEIRSFKNLFPIFSKTIKPEKYRNYNEITNTLKEIDILKKKGLLAVFSLLFLGMFASFLIAASVLTFIIHYAILNIVLAPLFLVTVALIIYSLYQTYLYFSLYFSKNNHIKKLKKQNKDMYNIFSFLKEYNPEDFVINPKTLLTICYDRIKLSKRYIEFIKQIICSHKSSIENSNSRKDIIFEFKDFFVKYCQISDEINNEINNMLKELLKLLKDDEFIEFFIKDIYIKENSSTNLKEIISYFNGEYHFDLYKESFRSIKSLEKKIEFYSNTYSSYSYSFQEAIKDQIIKQFFNYLENPNITLVDYEKKLKLIKEKILDKTCSIDLENFHRDLFYVIINIRRKNNFFQKEAENIFNKMCILDQLHFKENVYTVSTFFKIFEENMEESKKKDLALTYMIKKFKTKFLSNGELRDITIVLNQLIAILKDENKVELNTELSENFDKVAKYIFSKVIRQIVNKNAQNLKKNFLIYMAIFVHLLLKYNNVLYKNYKNEFKNFALKISKNNTLTHSYVLAFLKKCQKYLQISINLQSNVFK